MYHEEMLKESPRQDVFNNYAKELLCRYPQLKQEITICQMHINEQWNTIMHHLVLPPGNDQRDLTVILHGKL